MTLQFLPKKIISLLLVFISTVTTAQYSINLYTTTPQLANRISISGIAILNNKLYMAAERCKKLFVADLSTHQIVDTIQLISTDTLEIEGIAEYNKQLYCVSETNSKTYHINLITGKLTPQSYELDFSKLLGPFKGDGLEGIAINTPSNLLYVLLERNSTKDYAQIYTFEYNLTSAVDALQLNFRNSFSLKLDSVEMRYSDFCYDAATNNLLLLKSFYKNKIGRYSVETLALDNDGMPKGLPAVAENLNPIFFTQVIRSYENLGFDSNLEGIAIDEKGVIYITSDNAMGEANCEPNAEKPSKKTLVIELIKQ